MTIATTLEKKNLIEEHPCFGGNRHKYGRLHLAVAPGCNIKCGYCSRRHDCASENRPGVTSKLMNPKQALQRVRIAMEDESLSKIIRVAGIAGPGEPLANDATFETFGLIEKEYPHLIKCVSTNGLLLPDRLDEMLAVNVHSLTITINALDPEVGARIYSNINYRGEPVTGEDGVRLLINNQLEGLAAATRHGILTKVNTVLIPGINDDQITLIAHKVKELGAYVMNIMPVIPQADFAGIKPPTAMQLQEARDANEDIIVQFRHCSQCRADAIGLIGDKQSGGCQ